MYIAVCYPYRGVVEAKLFVREPAAIHWCREFMMKRVTLPTMLREEYLVLGFKPDSKTHERVDGLTWRMEYEPGKSGAYVKSVKAEDA